MELSRVGDRAKAGGVETCNSVMLGSCLRGMRVGQGGELGLGKNFEAEQGDKLYCKSGDLQSTDRLLKYMNGGCKRSYR